MTVVATTVAFEGKERGDTLWLAVEYPESAPPEELIEDLREVGWETEADRGRISLPPLNGVVEAKLTRRGSDLFGAWTKDERKRFVTVARAILRKHGFTRVPINRLPWQEFL